MKKNLYLLQNNDESKEMRKQVEGLLFSDEDANNQLALQLLEGGGVPQEFYPYLWIYSFSVNKNSDTYTQILKFLHKTLSEKQKSIYQNCLNFYTDKYDEYLDNLFAIALLEEVNKDAETSKDIHIFGEYLLLKHKLGASFLFHHKILPEKLIFENLIENNEDLDLSNFGLTSIPEIIGELTQITSLNIRENPLAYIPDEIKNLKNLKNLYIDDQLSDEIMVKLGDFFPLILSKIYEEKAWNKVNIDKFDFALNFMSQAKNLTPERSAVWEGLAWIYLQIMEYENGFESYKKAILYAENDLIKSNFLANLSSAYQRNRKPELSLKSAQEAIIILDKIPLNEWDEYAYFSFGLASQNVGKYDVALDNYKTTLQLDPYYGDGVVHYNCACVYANLNDRKSLLEELKNACNHSHFNWYKDALSDVDFEKYWNDEELNQRAGEIGNKY